MADGYKIKTDDGSQLGPMTLEGVEGYFRQGLVRHDALVQRPGSYNWVPLSEVLARDLKKAAPAKKAPPPAPAPQPARPRPPAVRHEPADEVRPRPRASSAGPIKALVALVLLAALAGGGFAAYRALVQQGAPAESLAPAPDVSQEALAARREKAIDAAVGGTPQFSRATVEFVMSQSMAQILEPHETFRRGQSLVSRGIVSLSAAESRELGTLMQAVYAALPARDRARLGAYLDKLRNDSLTRPEEDREMSVVMKTGVAKLSKERRARLQTLFEKAARAGAARR